MATPIALVKCRQDFTFATAMTTCNCPSFTFKEAGSCQGRSLRSELGMKVAISRFSPYQSSFSQALTNCNQQLDIRYKEESLRPPLEAIAISEACIRPNLS